MFTTPYGVRRGTVVADCQVEENVWRQQDSISFYVPCTLLMSENPMTGNQAQSLPSLTLLGSEVSK